MNAIPTSPINARTASGPTSMFTPSCSSTSALPQRPVLERLPCLATRTPAAARMNATIVDVFGVDSPLPPVPQLSNRSPPASTGTARSRRTMAKPVSSSAVSPLHASAARNAPICDGSRAPSMISPITRRARSRPRSSPATNRRMASRYALMPQEILQAYARRRGSPRSPGETGGRTWAGPCVAPP